MVGQGLEVFAAAAASAAEGLGPKSKNGHYVKLVRVTGPMRVCFCSEPVVYDLHYGRRSLLCVGNGCGICSVQRPRSDAFAAVIALLPKPTRVLFQVPYGCLVALMAVVRGQVGAGCSDWIGMVADFRRVRGCLRSPVAGEYVRHEAGQSRVSGENVESAVLHVLGVAQVSDFDDFESWRVRVGAEMLSRFRDSRPATCGGSMVSGSDRDA
jgi:hypothetical protein